MMVYIIIAIVRLTYTAVYCAYSCERTSRILMFEINRSRWQRYIPRQREPVNVGVGL